jgi:hypothetical protein
MLAGRTGHRSSSTSSTSIGSYSALTRQLRPRAPAALYVALAPKLHQVCAHFFVGSRSVCLRAASARCPRILARAPPAVEMRYHRGRSAVQPLNAGSSSWGRRCERTDDLLRGGRVEGSWGHRESGQRQAARQFETGVRPVFPYHSGDLRKPTSQLVANKRLALRRRGCSDRAHYGLGNSPDG